jgi:hypothetical protein
MSREDRYQIVLQRLYDAFEFRQYMYYCPPYLWEEARTVQDLVVGLGGLADKAAQQLTLDENDRDLVLSQCLILAHYYEISPGSLERMLAAIMRHERQQAQPDYTRSLDYNFRKACINWGQWLTESSRPVETVLRYRIGRLMFYVCCLDVEGSLGE